MAKAPEFKAQQGTPDQLPRGEAQQLNQPPPEPPAPVVEVQQPAPTPEPQAALATPADYEPNFVPQTDEEAFITGPTMRPDEPQTAGAFDTRTPPPNDVASWMPLFVEASSYPDAPPQLKSLTALLGYHLNNGQ